MQQKRILLDLHLKKMSCQGHFFKFIAKRVLCALGHIFNKVISGMVQNSDAVGA